MKPNKSESTMERDLILLSRENMNNLMLKLISDFGYVSGDELSDIFSALRPMLKSSKRLPHPFYNKEEATSYLLRKGLLTETGFSPFTYTISPREIGLDEKTLQKGFVEACGESSEVIQQFIKDAVTKKNRNIYLRRIALVAIAYEKVPSSLQMDFLLKSGVDENTAKEALQTFKNYMTKIEGLTFRDYHQ